MVSAKRTGIVAARQLNTIAKTMGRKRAVRLSSKRVQSDAGTYYEPVFSIGEETHPEIIDLVADMTRAMRGNIGARMKSAQSTVED